MPKVFISYAWNDGATLARQLHDRFNHTPGWSAWMDLELHAESVFSHELQNRINEADVVVVVISPEVNRREPPSFVQRELVYATQDGVNKPVFAAKAHDCPVPLIIAGVTFERFFPTTRFEEAFTGLVHQIERSPKHLTFSTTDPRELELAYLREVARQNGFFGRVFVDTAAETRIQPTRSAEPADPEVDMFLQELLAAIHPPDQHSPEDDGRTGEVKTFAALSEALGAFDRVAIIGDPGSGKTTTLRRFAYALGDAAAHDPTAPLPIFVPLGHAAGRPQRNRPCQHDLCRAVVGATPRGARDVDLSQIGLCRTQDAPPTCGRAATGFARHPQFYAGL